MVNNRLFTSLRWKIIFLLVVSFLVLFGILTLINNKRADAQTVVCGNGQSPGFGFDIVGATGGTTIPVSYGSTASIPFTFRIGLQVCYRNSGVHTTDFYFPSAGPAGVSGIAGQSVRISGIPTNPAPVGWYTSRSVPFSYTHPTPITSPTTVMIYVDLGAVNYFTNGVSGCVIAACGTNRWTFPVMLVPDAPTTAGSCTITSAPTSVRPGDRFSVSVRINNTGATTWTTGQNYFLGSADPRDNSIWGVNRTGIGGNIAPGGNRILTFSITAPSTPGSHTFARQMLREGVAWFGNVCSRTIQVEITDLCLNIPGVQATVPTGMTRDAAGNCNLPVPVGVNCPSYPPYTLNFNTVQSISLPRSAPGGHGHETDPWTYSSTGASSGPSTTEYTQSNTTTSTRQTVVTVRTTTYTRDITYTQIYRNPSNPHRTIIDQIIDEWGDDLPIPPIRNDGGGDYIYLDYKEYFDNYPYDTHTPVITYRIGYERKQRIGIVTQTSTRTELITQIRTRADATSPWTPYSPANRNAIPVPGPAFAAPSQTTGSASVSNPDNLAYSGRRDGSNPILWSGALPSLSAPNMPPCFPRQFSVNPENIGANLLPNREDPTSSTFSFRLPTTLSVSNGGLRTPTSVSGITYTVNYRAEGYSNPSFSGSMAGTLDVPNTSLASSVIVGQTDVLNQAVTVNVPANIRAGDRVCWTVTVGEPTGTVGVGGTVLTRTGPARESSPPACTVTAVDEPYTRFYGADVFAGGGFNEADGTCSAVNANAAAIGTMRSDRLSGSGAQLAVFALSQIDRIQPLSRTTRNPLQLAFSNQSPPANVPSRLFGGGFGSVLCAEDYFGAVPDGTVWNTTDSTVDIGTLTSGRHYYRRNSGAINLSGLLPDDLVSNKGRRVVIYVDGNVSIQPNTSAVGANRFGFVNNTNWASVDHVPSLYVIATGDINIDYRVNELDGSYISQGGNINTCAIGTSAPTNEQITVECRTQLRVNGAFLANRVNLLRTLGSLRHSTVGEEPAPTNAAESFIYNPALWLTSGGNLPTNSRMQIDSYISLPPSL